MRITNSENIISKHDYTNFSLNINLIILMAHFV